MGSENHIWRGPPPVRKVDLELIDQIKEQDCVICGKGGKNDPSHIKTVGSGGPDTDWNCFSMCRQCHSEWHQKGRLSFCADHPEFFRLLRYYGWQIEGNKLWNSKLNEH